MLSEAWALPPGGPARCGAWGCCWHAWPCGWCRQPSQLLYVLEHVTHLILTWDTVLIGMSLGIGTALLSAAWPTLTALRLSPLAAMQQRGVYSGRQTPLWPSTLVGLGLVLAAYGLSRLPAVAGMAVFGYLACLALVLGISCLIPLVFRP